MATYYISPTGNDTTGNGTLANPWQTLAKFLSSSIAGDTCICAAGTYTFTNATFTNRIIQGAIGGANTSTAGWTVFDGGSADVGWDVSNGITIINNIWFLNIIGATKSLIHLNVDFSGDLTVNSCRFSNCTAYSSTTFLGLIGIDQHYTGGPGIVHITIQGCIFDDIDFAGGNYPAYFCMRGAPIGSTFNWYNNVFIIRTALTGAPNGLFTAYGGPAVFTFKNSIFRNLQTALNFIGTYDVPTKFTAINCSFDANIPPGSITKTDCLTNTNPLFINENNGNFNLRPTSPCIDTGTIV